MSRYPAPLECRACSARICFVPNDVSSGKARRCSPSVSRRNFRLTSLSDGNSTTATGYCDSEWDEIPSTSRLSPYHPNSTIVSDSSDSPELLLAFRVSKHPVVRRTADPEATRRRRRFIATRSPSRVHVFRAEESGLYLGLLAGSNQLLTEDSSRVAVPYSRFNPPRSLICMMRLTLR